MECFKVMRNGKLWTNWLKSEDLANEHINESVFGGDGEFEEYKVLPMTKEDMEE